MSNQEASNISDEQLGEHGRGHYDPERDPPDKPNINDQAGLSTEGGEIASEHQTMQAAETPLDERPAKTKKRVNYKHINMINDHKTFNKERAMAEVKQQLKKQKNKGTTTKDNNEDYPEGEEMEVDANKPQALMIDDEMLNLIFGKLQTFQDQLEETQQCLEEHKNQVTALNTDSRAMKDEIRYMKAQMVSKTEELANTKRKLIEQEMKNAEFEKRISEEEDKQHKAAEKIIEIDELVEVKTREFGKQARLAVDKTHKAQLAAEETKTHADKISNKIENIEKQYEDKLGKIGVAMDNRFKECKTAIDQRCAEMTKEVEDWRKEAAIAANRLKQTEAKVATTANTQKQVTNSFVREVKKIQENPWLTVNRRKNIEMMSEKSAAIIKQPPTPKDTYKVRILDPTDIEQMKPAEDYADMLCSEYKDEKTPAVLNIWRTKTRNITIITESEKVYEERHQWVVKLNPEFQIIQEEDWPKLVVKGIMTDTDPKLVKEGLEKSFGVKFRVDPVRIGTNHSVLGDTYVVSFKSEEDRYDAWLRDAYVRYRKLRVFEYRPRPKGANNKGREPTKNTTKNNHEVNNSQETTATANSTQY